MKLVSVDRALEEHSLLSRDGGTFLMILAVVDLHLHSTLNINSVQHRCIVISHVITILLVIIIEKRSLPVIKSGGKASKKKFNINGTSICSYQYQRQYGVYKCMLTAACITKS